MDSTHLLCFTTIKPLTDWVCHRGPWMPVLHKLTETGIFVTICWQECIGFIFRKYIDKNVPSVVLVVEKAVGRSARFP